MHDLCVYLHNLLLNYFAVVKVGIFFLCCRTQTNISSSLCHDFCSIYSTNLFVEFQELRFEMSQPLLFRILLRWWVLGIKAKDTATILFFFWNGSFYVELQFLLFRISLKSFFSRLLLEGKDAAQNFSRVSTENEKQFKH